MAFTDIQTYNGMTIRKLHSVGGSKCFGWLTGTKQDNGDLFDLTQHASLADARRAIWYPVICNDESLRFLVVDKGVEKVIGECGKVVGYTAIGSCYKSLAEARAAASIVINTKTKVTLPKSAYKQNQPGYTPSST
jgi:hypothetical protein